MCTCQKCNKKYDVDIIVSDIIWSEIRPNKEYNDDKESGLLCPECIITELEKLVRNGLGSLIVAHVQ